MISNLNPWELFENDSVWMAMQGVALHSAAIVGGFPAWGATLVATVGYNSLAEIYPLLAYIDSETRTWKKIMKHNPNNREKQTLT